MSNSKLYRDAARFSGPEIGKKGSNCSPTMDVDIQSIKKPVQLTLRNYSSDDSPIIGDSAFVSIIYVNISRLPYDT